MKSPPDDDLWKAYHEAGHAVAAHALGGELQWVSILPTQHYQGICQFSMNRTFVTYSDRPAINKHICQIVISLAGPAAQTRFAPGSCEPEQAGKDRCDALESMVRLAAIRGAYPHDLAYYEELADRFVYEDENWAAIQSLAEALCRCQRLSGLKSAGIIDRVWEDLYG